MHYIILFLFSFIISFILIPLIIYYSKKKNIVDIPNSRKIHHRPISRLGGVAIFLSFIIVLFMYYFLLKNKFKFNLNFNLWLFSCAMFLSFLIGFIDDIINIRARYKLILQIITGFLVYLSGLKFTMFKFLDVFNVKFGVFSSIITILWVISFMNAINLIDGLDGLASGIVLIATIFILIISLIQKVYIVTIISSILIGSIFGFYIFNFPPAKIFMGDGGAYFLGFMYSTITLMGIKKSSVTTMFVIPLILLLIPIIDVLQVIFKRIKVNQNVFTADKNHIHHKLLSIGITNKQILLLLYSFTIILGLFAILMLLINEKYGFIVFLLIFLMVFIGAYFFNLIQGIYNKNNNKEK